MSTQRIRRWSVDLSPLRTSRDFRLLLTTQTISSLGAFITYVAVPLQVARLTHSPFQVGLLGLCELAPLLVTALLGGALADYLDRRLLVLAGEATMMLTGIALLLNAASPDPRLWVLFVIAAVGSGVDGLQRPAIEGLMQRVVPIRHGRGVRTAITGIHGVIAGWPRDRRRCHRCVGFFLGVRNPARHARRASFHGLL